MSETLAWDERRYAEVAAADDSLIIPADGWGNTWIDAKHEVPSTFCACDDAAIISPRAREFRVGQMVRVDNVGYAIHNPTSSVSADDSPEFNSAPHWRHRGRIVEVLEDRLYAVKFNDGAVVGFYANELILAGEEVD